jgi:PhnB protein
MPKNTTQTSTPGVPEGYRSVTPYFAAHDAPRLIEFLKRAFGAKELARHVLENGMIANAELEIGDSMVMLGEAPKERPALTAMLYLYVADSDAAYRRAVEAGGQSVMEPNDRPYGDRVGAVADPMGNQWWIAARMAKR